MKSTLQRFFQAPLFLFGFIFFSTLSFGANRVELHAHLFMKTGMSWMFRGHFNEPLSAHSWKDRFSSMANPESLEKSEIQILVATLYAHPFLVFSMRNSIREQIHEAESFVNSHPGWQIAHSPSEARTAIAQGKRVLILALEGISGIIENDADFEEFITQKGIRIVNLLHLTDDEFGGVAFLAGFRALSSPWAFLTQLFSAPRDSVTGARLNANGLTPQGLQMAQKLMDHHVWIDLAHASDESQKKLIELHHQKNTPLLYAHTSLRKYLKAERGISEEQLKEVQKSHGIVGLIPSAEMLSGTTVAETLCPQTCKDTCIQSVSALATQYQEVGQVLGYDSVVMGSDYNGGLPHLAPTCETQTSLDQEGLWNIGQTGDLWKALNSRLKNPAIPPQQDLAVESFLKAWEKI